MGVVLDLIGSTMFATLVLLMGLELNTNVSNGGNSYRADVVVQEGLVSIVQAVEYDFRKMGYNVADPTTVIVRADSDHISFLSDLDDNGVIDTVNWYVGRFITASPNPNDRILYRRLARPGLPVSLVGSAPGVTRFGLRYLNQEGQTTTMNSQIWIIETTIRVESPWKVQDATVMDEKHSQWVTVPLSGDKPDLRAGTSEGTDNSFLKGGSTNGKVCSHLRHRTKYSCFSGSSEHEYFRQ